VYNSTSISMISTQRQIPNLEKIGNLAIYLSQKLDNLYLTRLLKFLYIIDEQSVVDTGVPVTWLQYKVWKNGPVATAIYNDLNFYNNELLKDYIAVNKNHKTKGLEIIPVRKFDDSEFSDYEIELIDRIIDTYGTYNSDQLIKLLHEENSLWHKIVKENNLEDKFSESNTSPFTIELTDKIKGDAQKLDLYNSVKESLNF
jgi:uncharacterized phage-associated protein